MHPQRLFLRLLFLASWLVVPTTAIGQRIRLPGSGSSNKKKPEETAAAAVVAAVGSSSSTATVSTVIAGRLKAFWQTLSQVDLSQLHKGLDHVLNWGDALWIAAVGWWTEPLARVVYQVYYDRTVIVDNNGSDDDDDSTESVVLARQEAYKKTWLFRVASTVGQLGRVMGLVYATDIATVLIYKLGFTLPEGMNRRLANLIYALFGAQKVRQLKTWGLRNWFGKHDTDVALKGRERAVDLIVDGTIGFLLLFMIQDIFSVTMGRSLQSLFAIGGISGIMISLASKGKTTISTSDTRLGTLQAATHQT